MPWQCEEPVHQQVCYELISPNLFQAQHQKVQECMSLQSPVYSYLLDFLKRFYGKFKILSMVVDSTANMYIEAEILRSAMYILCDILDLHLH